MTETKPAKRPLIAAALSVLFPGLGHVYLREWLRTVMWLTLMFAVVSLLIPPELIPEEYSMAAILEASRDVPNDISLAVLGLRTLNIVDAYVIARRGNQRQAMTTGQQCPACGHELDDEDLSFCPWCAAELDDPTEDDTRADNSLFRF
ncbi:MAG: DUF7575 domain-containing protein [Halorhabdus sp.]